MHKHISGKTGHPRYQAQSGAVLVTGVIFLVVLTMFVLAMVRGGSMEERMARNARDQQVALQAAEAVLRNAEQTMFGQAPFDPFVLSDFTVNCQNGLCNNPDNESQWTTIDWTNQARTRSFAAATSEIEELNGVATQPRYIIEVVSVPRKVSSATPCEHGLARITARGVGANGAVAFVQSTVRFRVFTNICD